MIFVIGIYSAMIISTNSLIRDVESVFRLEVDRSVTEGRPIDQYNYNNHAEARGREVGGISYSLRRRFVWHNFQYGYIWARYTRVVYDIDGRILTGASRIPTRWRIERQNGRWEIVEIFERP